MVSLCCTDSEDMHLISVPKCRRRVYFYLICGCCRSDLRIYSKFLNKTEHRDLRRQVATGDEAKRSEQTLPTAEISYIFAAPAGILHRRSENGRECSGRGSEIFSFLKPVPNLIHEGCGMTNRWRDETK